MKGGIFEPGTGTAVYFGYSDNAVAQRYINAGYLFVDGQPIQQADGLWLKWDFRTGTAILDAARNQVIEDDEAAKEALKQKKEADRLTLLATVGVSVVPVLDFADVDARLTDMKNNMDMLIEYILER